MAGLIYNDTLYTSGGQPNVIETVSVNGTNIPPVSKNVDITIPAVSVAMAGTASASTVRKQQITVDNNTYDIFGTSYMEQNATLSTSDSTIVTFTHEEILATSDIEVSISDWNCVPENVSVTYNDSTEKGTVAITLPKVDDATDPRRVRIYIR